MANPKDYLPEIKQVIAKYLNLSKYRVFLFGSRAAGKNAKYSDYDIGIVGQEPIPTAAKINIEGDLEDSLIPMKVDIVDFLETSENFKKVALTKTIDL